jgi:hypothetical protein
MEEENIRYFFGQGSGLIDIIGLEIDPKNRLPEWKSEHYRAWIHESCKCYCGRPLSLQEGGLHHHLHTGGKDHPRDQMLTRFCGECHTVLHFSHSAKMGLYKRYRLTDELVTKHCVHMLMRYIFELSGINILMNLIGATVSQIESQNRVEKI